MTFFWGAGGAAPGHAPSFAAAGASPQGVLFHSDWSTGTGTGDAAVRDTATGDDPWDTGDTGSGLDVTSASGLDFPTTNVLVTRQGPSLAAAYHVRIDPDDASPILPTFGIGDHLYLRYYWRLNDFTGTWSVTADPAFHPIEDGGDGGAWGGSVANWQHRIWVNTDGTYYFRYDTDGATYPDSLWAPTGVDDGILLNKDQTYRFEIHTWRTGATTFRAEFRIYNSSDVLLYGEDDFTNANESSTSGTVDLGWRNVENFRGLQMGTNGVGDNGAPGSTIDFAYLGAVAISDTDWLGPYSGGV